MKSPHESILPNRDAFASDPIGYSLLGWHKWGMAQTIAGFDIDISKPSTSEDLKSPILWLTQAHAMAECARIILQNNPNLDNLTTETQGICDCQYCAAGLMLVGYSLEICLKAMLIIKQGISTYAQNEKTYRHHRLVDLASFIPNFDAKDKAILQALSHFTLWAGRYPDPGSEKIDNVEKVFSLSETYKISAKDLFELAARVMKHTALVTAQYESG